MTEHSGAEALLEVKGLYKQFGSSMALDGIDFTLNPGEFLTLLGPSGCGKTTTLMSLAGFVIPTSGRIFHKGRDITRAQPETRDFGIVFQGYALFPHMTVLLNVSYPLRIRKVGAAEAQRRALAALAQVQLDEFADRHPRQLSGGQQQRVALARALVYRPEILLLDEPLSALDKKLRTDLQWELRTLNKQSGASFLYVTHDQEEALSMSDRIAIFNKGQIAQIGTPSELYERPANLFVAGFLGRSNVLPAIVRSVDGQGCMVEYEGGRLNVAHVGIDCGTGEAVSLVVRPHRLHLAAQGPTGLRARVEAISYAGNLVNYLLRTPQGQPLYWEHVAGTQPAFASGDTLCLAPEEQYAQVLEAVG